MGRKTVTLSDSVAKLVGKRRVSYDVVFNDEANGIAFVISQLSTVLPKVYEQKYPEMIQTALVPVDTSVPEFAQSVNWVGYDGVTMGKFLGANAKDIPNVAMEAKINSTPLAVGGLKASWSIDELRATSAVNMPIDRIQFNLCYRGAMEHNQRVVFFGDKDLNMTGLFNNPNVMKDNSTVDWNTAKPEEIYKDLITFVSGIWEDTKGVFTPNTLLIDMKRYNIISSTPMNLVTGDTILSFFLKNNIAKIQKNIDINVVAIPQLSKEVMNEFGGDNNDRMVAYELSPDNLKTFMAIPPRFLAPQARDYTVYVPMEYKFGGTVFIFPMCAAYRTFTTPIS